MLEYGEAYLEANERMLEEMHARMSPEAVTLAQVMADEAIAQEELEDA